MFSQYSARPVSMGVGIAGRPHAFARRVTWLDRAEKYMRARCLSLRAAADAAISWVGENLAELGATSDECRFTVRELREQAMHEHVSPLLNLMTHPAARVYRRHLRRTFRTQVDAFDAQLDTWEARICTAGFPRSRFVARQGMVETRRAHALRMWKTLIPLTGTGAASAQAWLGRVHQREAWRARVRASALMLCLGRAVERLRNVGWGVWIALFASLVLSLYHVRILRTAVLYILSFLLGTAATVFAWPAAGLALRAGEDEDEDEEEEEEGEEEVEGNPNVAARSRALAIANANANLEPWWYDDDARAAVLSEMYFLENDRADLKAAGLGHLYAELVHPKRREWLTRTVDFFFQGPGYPAPSVHLLLWFDPLSFGFVYKASNTVSHVDGSLLVAAAAKYCRVYRCLDLFLDDTLFPFQRAAAPPGIRAYYLDKEVQLRRRVKMAAPQLALGFVWVDEEEYKNAQLRERGYDPARFCAGGPASGSGSGAAASFGGAHKILPALPSLSSALTLDFDGAGRSAPGVDSLGAGQDASADRRFACMDLVPVAAANAETEDQEEEDAMAMAVYERPRLPPSVPGGAPSKESQRMKQLKRFIPDFETMVTMRFVNSSGPPNVVAWESMRKKFVPQFSNEHFELAVRQMNRSRPKELQYTPILDTLSDLRAHTNSLALVRMAYQDATPATVLQLGLDRVAAAREEAEYLARGNGYAAGKYGHFLRGLRIDPRTRLNQENVLLLELEHKAQTLFLEDASADPAVLLAPLAPLLGFEGPAVGQQPTAAVSTADGADPGSGCDDDAEEDSAPALVADPGCAAVSAVLERRRRVVASALAGIEEAAEFTHLAVRNTKKMLANRHIDKEEEARELQSHPYYVRTAARRADPRAYLSKNHGIKTLRFDEWDAARPATGLAGPPALLEHVDEESEEEEEKDDEEQDEGNVEELRTT